MVCLVGENENEDEKRKMEEMHQERVNQMIKSAECSVGLLRKITMPTAWRGAQFLKREEDDFRLLDRCEARRKERAKHWQCYESVQKLEDKPWKNEDLKNSEEALPRLKECDFGEGFKIVQGENKSRMRRLPPKSPL